jgi:hypothetical protein
VRVAQATSFESLRMSLWRAPPFDRVLAASPSDASDLFEAAKAELQQRLAFWKRRWGAEPKRRATRLASAITVAVLACFIVGILPGVVNALLLGVGGVLLFFAVRRERKRELLGFIERRVCPDCGYDLKNSRLVVHGADCSVFGPPACPECGSTWPLVPPAIESPPPGRS